MGYQTKKLPSNCEGGESDHTCELCNKTFETVKALHGHMRIHQNIKLKKPEKQNPAVEIGQKRRIENIQTKDNEDQESKSKGVYTCTACNKSFNSYQAMGGHCSSHNKIKRKLNTQKVEVLKLKDMVDRNDNDLAEENSTDDDDLDLSLAVKGVDKSHGQLGKEGSHNQTTDDPMSAGFNRIAKECMEMGIFHDYLALNL